MLLHDRLRRAVQVHGAAVVAQPRPQPDNFRQRRRRQLSHRREPVEKGAILGDYAVHLRLLQHHLREKNAVGTLRSAPGQCAPVAAVPAQQRVPELLHRFRPHVQHRVGGNCGLGSTWLFGIDVWFSWAA